MLLELAISGKSTDLISNDNDLLSLRSSHSDDAKRLRQRLHMLRISTPFEFLKSQGLLSES